VKSVLALDLGTHCGYACGLPNTLRSGTWDLATDAEVEEWGKTRLTRRMDPRPLRLWRKIRNLVTAMGSVPEIFIFEDVEFQTYTLQCQLWSSLRTGLWFAAHELEPQLIDCVPVSTLKKFATGFGGANKKAMQAALVRHNPVLGKNACDDNEVDALWLWIWANKHLSRI
jgi:hypothetical protein